MPTVLFTMPLKKGKTKDYKASLNECLGPRKSDYADLLMRYGLNTIKIWIHTLNGRDYAMFIHEMDDDATKRLKGWSKSTHPFKRKNACEIVDVLQHGHSRQLKAVANDLVYKARFVII